MTQTTFEQGLDSVAELVKRFGRNAATYRSPEYNETRVRIEFINPLFEALGWDVNNREGVAPQYQEVLHEFSAEVEGTRKAPDYAFRTGSQAPKFYVEAKKPGVNVKTNADAAYQLRRYAWSARLPLSLLTDFEELAVYDCRSRPSNGDKASVGRVQFYACESYPDRWRDIWDVFSRQAVREGSFDRFAQREKGKGDSLIDAEFLKEIQGWRELLARNMALRNAWLAPDDLNDAVQRTIDRIIFMRMAEDRGIEEYGRLLRLAQTPSPVKSAGEGSSIYADLIDLCRRADARYNSGLFDLSADTLTPRLSVDDKALQSIIGNLYFPSSPYEFSVLPIRILGNIYEQFLGQVIRLTAGHQAKVEEKPEVKKAGGVYYTPEYIVDYIVRRTVGQLVAERGKSPKQLAGFRALDMACGSGSFLLGAYQCLLDYYLRWYSEHQPEKHTQAVYQTPSPNLPLPGVQAGQGGGWRLTIAEKKRILTTHIFGVDIDRQAVEVTKLSLLLKVLEGESDETLGQQLTLFAERALPNLDSNIKCGNSLIGPDYFTGQLLPDTDELRRVNPFDWETQFPDAMKAGGFDCIVGNPPYIQLSMADYYDRNTNVYLSRNYSSSMGRLNTFGLFIERALGTLLARKGLLSFIVPNTLLTQEYYQHLRQEMLKYRLQSITTYKYPVFAGAVVETVVFVVQNARADHNRIDIVECDNRLMSHQAHVIEQDAYLTSHRNAFLVKVDSAAIGLRVKLDEAGARLKDIANINQAIALKYDRSQSLFKQRKAKNYKPVLDGRNIQRYKLEWGGYYLAYDVDKIHSCKRIDIFEAEEKIFFRRVGDRLIATYDDAQYYALNTLVVITLVPHAEVSLKYVLGLLNSRLMNFYYVTYLKSTKKVFSEIQARQLAQLPIRTINFSDPADVAHHDRMVTLVEQMLELHKRHAAASQADRELYQRQIDATDREIDKLVYELYGLTEEEVKIVQAS